MNFAICIKEYMFKSIQILFIGLLSSLYIGFAEASEASWEKIADFPQNKITLYIATGSIRAEGNEAQATFLIDFTQPKADDAHSLTRTVKFDCSKNIFTRVGNFVFWSSSMGRGQVVKSAADGGTGDSMEDTNSPTAYMQRNVCSRVQLLAKSQVQKAQNISSLRIVVKEECAQGRSLTGFIAAVAPPDFNFNDGPATRRVLDGLLSQAPQNENCPTAALLVENRAKVNCGGRSLHPLLTQGDSLYCMTFDNINPPDITYAYRISTPPGKVENLLKGEEAYWNSRITPQEKVAKAAAEARQYEVRAANEKAAAVRDNEARNARSQALLSLKNSVVSTSSKPSETDMKRRVEQQIDINSQGYIRLVDFQKKDGIAKEFGGVKFYEMEWVATLEVTKDCLWNTESFEAVPPPQGMDGILYASSGYQAVNRGQRINFSGKTTFKKTERGWRE
jgi:hypothetical protein